MASAQLYYDDVNEGDAVRPLTFFMDQMQLIKWAVASGNRGPGHYDMFHTQSRGGGMPSVTGQLKTALLERMLRDWAGPKCWVKRMSVQYRRWEEFYDLKTLGGEVAAKREADGLRLVDLDLWMRNSGGDVTTKGSATMVLPAKG